MAEGYYRWALGPDEQLFPLVDYANIACGLHAGDPSGMLRAVRLAKAAGVGVGAHPGLDDVKGFGRRALPLTPDECTALALYQLGALKAMADAEGVRVSHVKPHGAFYFLLRDDAGLARAFAAAHVAVNGKSVPLIGLKGTHMEDAARGAGVPFVPELFVDIDYDSEGNLLSVPNSNRCTPEGIRAKVRSLLEKGATTDKQGNELKIPAAQGTFTICLHSDMPTALENAKAAREVLDEYLKKQKQ